jgi:K+-transporting ATPase ATPase A chain
MTLYSYLQIGIYFVVLILLVKPLGLYMARVYQGESTFLDRIIRPIERLFYRLTGVDPDDEMDWKKYALALLVFSALSVLVVYLLQRLQRFLPLNPQKFGATTSDLAFNTAVSFITNTNWQVTAARPPRYLTEMVD